MTEQGKQTLQITVERRFYDQLSQVHRAVGMHGSDYLAITLDPSYQKKVEVGHTYNFPVRSPADKEIIKVDGEPAEVMICTSVPAKVTKAAKPSKGPGR